jgi:hypothetical protein
MFSNVLLFTSNTMSPRYLPYPGQLPAFRFESEPKPKQIRPKQVRPNRIRPKQVRLNVAERRAAMRVSMSTLRRQKLQQFDYEAYQANFANRYTFTKVIH